MADRSFEVGDGAIVVIGGGLVGALAAAVTAGKGNEVHVFERWPDPRVDLRNEGRSINLVLTPRGRRAIRLVGDELEKEVLSISVPVYGRMVHGIDGKLTATPYGKDGSECNYSIVRSQLHCILLSAAEKAGAKIHFESTFKDLDFENHRLNFILTPPRVPRGQAAPEMEIIDFSVNNVRKVIGADGAGSGVRKMLKGKGFIESHENLLGHGYKELFFPYKIPGVAVMDKEYLHLWPRGDHMLMGLANTDGSFTGTIYLPTEGSDYSFDVLEDNARLLDFWTRVFPDAIPLLGGDNALIEEFGNNPRGLLGSVTTNKWNINENGVDLVLVGDAAHAITPFFGQGLNAGLEDITYLDTLLDLTEGDWRRAGEAYQSYRKPCGDAIRDLAYDNFVEMCDRAADPVFQLKKRVESIVEKTFPEKYRSRYALVVYSHNHYSLAQEVGVVQQDLLQQLCEGLTNSEDVDLAKAEELIDTMITPMLKAKNVSLDFKSPPQISLDAPDLTGNC